MSGPAMVAASILAGLTALAAATAATGAHEFVPLIGDALSWTACPLFSPYTPPYSPPAGNNDAPFLLAECTYTTLPLFHDRPAAGSFRVFIKRLRANPASSTPAPNTLWLQTGGPGDSTAGYMEVIMRGLSQQFGVTGTEPGGLSVDMYMMDHRGTGRSDKWTCERSLAEWSGSRGGSPIVIPEFPDCVAEVMDGRGTTNYSFAFTADNAARDVAAIIDLTLPEPRTSAIYLYGLSYGSMWTQRIVFLFPNLATGTILDGVVSLAGGRDQRLTFDRYDVNTDRTGRYFLSQYCAKDALCSEKWGAAPLTNFIAKFNAAYPKDGSAGNCPAVTGAGGGELGISSFQLRTYFGQLLVVGEAMRHLIPAIMYRLARCTNDDVAVIKNFQSWMTATFTVAGLQIPIIPEGFMVQFNIGGSEMFDASVDLNTLQGWINDTYISMGLSYPLWSAVHDAHWPLYPTNPQTFNRTLHSTKTNFLLLNGDLDGQTPLELVKFAYANIANDVPSAQLVVLPGVRHITTLHSLMVHNPTNTCSYVLIANWVSGGAAPLTASGMTCVADLIPVTFGGAAAFNTAVLGVSDAWEGVISPPPTCDAGSSGFTNSQFYAAVITLSVLLFASLALNAVSCWQSRKRGGSINTASEDDERHRPLRS